MNRYIFRKKYNVSRSVMIKSSPTQSPRELNWKPVVHTDRHSPFGARDNPRGQFFLTRSQVKEPSVFLHWYSGPCRLQSLFPNKHSSSSEMGHKLLFLLHAKCTNYGKNVLIYTFTLSRPWVERVARATPRDSDAGVRSRRIVAPLAR